MLSLLVQRWSVLCVCDDCLSWSCCTQSCAGGVTAAFKGLVSEAGDAAADADGIVALLSWGQLSATSLEALLTASAAGASAVLAFISQHNKRQWGAV